MATPSKRRSRADEFADVLVERLATYGLVLSHKDARLLIKLKNEAAAERLRVTARTALNYLDVEMVQSWADEMAFSRAPEAPGADVFTAPRTALLDLRLLATTVAALGEGIRFWLAQDRLSESGRPSVRIDEMAAALSSLGVIAITEADDSSHGGVRVPPMLLRRMATLLNEVADEVEANPDEETAGPYTLAFAYTVRHDAGKLGKR